MRDFLSFVVLQYLLSVLPLLNLLPVASCNPYDLQLITYDNCAKFNFNGGGKVPNAFLTIHHPGKSKHRFLKQQTTVNIPCKQSFTSKSLQLSGGMIQPDKMSMGKNCKKGKVVHSFHEARRIVRGHGFSSVEEFLEYECAGAYQVPKNANIIYQNEWKGWVSLLQLRFIYTHFVGQSFSCNDN